MQKAHYRENTEIRTSQRKRHRVPESSISESPFFSGCVTLPPSIRITIYMGYRLLRHSTQASGSRDLLKHHYVAMTNLLATWLNSDSVN